MKQPSQPFKSNSPTWSIVLAFALLYLTWGTTYFAIRQGVHTERLPPALFGGVRVSLAGWLLLAYLGLRGENLRMPGREFFWVAVSGLLLFVGGNGLITFALDQVPSGVTAILVSSTPLWMAVMEMAWPRGDRLAGRGWLGLFIGLGGVVLLLWPKADQATQLLQNAGPIWVIGSTLFWALGSLVLRYRKRTGSHLAAAAYQMILGGTSLALVGVVLDEVKDLTPERFTWGACFSFFYLLIVSSLVGFIAFNWLLGHVRAALVSTYAYVNPLIAIVVGWLLGGEDLTLQILLGMVVIVAGVALVRWGGALPRRRDSEDDRSPYQATKSESTRTATRSLML